MTEVLGDDAFKVQENVTKAETLYRLFSREILSRETFCHLLRDYTSEVDKNRRLMKEVGLPDLCSWCATKVQGGGCCGSHIATWYDPVTLLLNLLMGVKIQNESYYADSCRFLGKDGCTLKARYHFCVNYLCSKILNKFDETTIQRLKQQAGAELFMAWQLEIFLRDFLKKKAVDPKLID